jgi:hypothetical protein
MMEEKKYPISDSFDFSLVIEEMQKLPNAAMEKMHDSKKRPVELIENYLDTKIKNDSMLVRRLLRIYFSAYTNEPINGLLLSPTSEGKTYSTVEVSNVFPQEDVIAVGRISPTALIHDHGILVDLEGNPIQDKLDKLEKELFQAQKNNNKDEIWEIKQIQRNIMETARNMVDLTHKILLFLDNPKPDTYEMLKPILSHDKKEILYKTTKGDGSLKVKETIIRGWPATIICSAKNEAKNDVWAEIASREFIFSPNTDISKYKAANKLTSQKLGIPTLFTEKTNEKELTKFYVKQLIFSLKKLCNDGNNPVWNVFAEKMHELFPSN